MFKSNDRFDVTALHLVAVYSGGEINLDHGGYITKDVRGQGFEPSEGPGQGYGKSLVSYEHDILPCFVLWIGH